MYGETAVLLFLLALLVQKLQLEVGMVSVGISIAYVLSCFLGGFLAGKIQRTKKFLWGIFLGIWYMLVMFGITILVKKGMDTSFGEFLVNLLLCLGGGMLGGMVS